MAADGASPSSSSACSDDDTERSFSDTKAFGGLRGRSGSAESEVQPGWELEWIDDSKLVPKGEEGAGIGRFYKLKFKGYLDMEWQPEDNIDALELIRCYWEHEHLGQELCIKAQQRLLKEIDKRSDSESEDQHRKNKTRKQLKPRPKLNRPAGPDEADSDWAGSSSSSSDDEDDDDGRRPLTFELADLSLTGSNNSKNGSSSTSPCQVKYVFKKPENRQLLSTTFLNPTPDHETEARKSLKLSQFVRRIKPLMASPYCFKNPHRAKRAEELLEEIESLKGSGLKQTDVSPRTKTRLKLNFKDPSQGSHPAPLTSPTTRSEPAPTRENVSDSSTDSQDLQSRMGSPGPSTVRVSSHSNPDNLSQHTIQKGPPQQPPGTPVNQIKSPLLRPPERRSVPDEDNGLGHHRNVKRKIVDPHPHLDNLPTNPSHGLPPPSFYRAKQQCLRKVVRWAS
ncbi:hypothetical protein PGT21_031330 [Puccinia graminis f. sp. tritici]|uniref:Chromo domain-containing protein n=1 Tax=Puccinia graminis f. sp. tritici TaxID=56615 RepID=A0A5B0QP77_PUCGR|nr:hypothetical protein PGT21_031330 [Puccinia graminis f. sp. tritici]